MHVGAKGESEKRKENKNDHNHHSRSVCAMIMTASKGLYFYPMPDWRMPNSSEVGNIEGANAHFILVCSALIEFARVFTPARILSSFVARRSWSYIASANIPLNTLLSSWR
ncbi:hypothetical protein V6000_003814 [Aspergillus fumigatus]